MELKPRPCDAPWRNYESPEGTREYSAVIDGWLRTWKEYVPSCYDGSRPVPLVLSLHGSAYHKADINTAWQLIAERENFIVAYPQSLVEEIKFNVWNTFSAEEGMPDDVEYIDKLIDLMLKKYNIDQTRIYIQGQSVGDGMASTYLFRHGDRIAAGAPLSGPTSPVNFVDPKTGEIVRYPACPVPVIRTHGSEDTMQPMGSLGKICVMAPSGEERPLDHSEQARRDKWIVGQKINLDVWRKVNGCDRLPKLGMRGRYNWLVYEGHPCDVVFYIVEGGEHGPYLDMADNIWTSFFSGYRRVDGKSVYVGANRTVKPDEDAVALAARAAFAYVGNRLVPVGEPGQEIKEIQGEFYVPVDFLEKAFPGTVVETYAGRQAARIAIGGGRMQVAMGNRSVVWNESLRDMPTTLFFDGSLYVPIAWIARLACGYEPVSGYHVCYLGHGGKLSYDFAYVIRELLGTELEVTPLECLKREMELRAENKKDYKPHNVAGEKYSGGPEEIFAVLKEGYERAYADFICSEEGHSGHRNNETADNREFAKEQEKGEEK